MRSANLISSVAFRVIVATVTFILGVSMAGLWAVKIRKAKVEQIEQRIIVLSICDVIRNEDQHVNKVVHVRGILIGFHELLLYDPDCKREGNYTRVDLDSSARARLVALASNANQAVLRKGNFFLQVVLSGRLERVQAAATSQSELDHEPSAQRYVQSSFRLTDVAVEKASVLSDDLN